MHKNKYQQKHILIKVRSVAGNRKFIIRILSQDRTKNNLHLMQILSVAQVHPEFSLILNKDNEFLCEIISSMACMYTETVYAKNCYANNFARRAR